MRKITIALLAVILATGSAASQNKPVGLVLTIPGLHSLAPEAFEGGVGLLIPLKNFDLRPALGLNVSSQSNGIDQSSTALKLNLDLLLPLTNGFFKTYYGGGIGFGYDRLKQEVYGGETTTSVTGFGARGLFGIKCEPLKNVTLGTELYLNYWTQDADTDVSSSGMAKPVAALSPKLSGNKFALQFVGAIVVVLMFDICPGDIAVIPF